jgi:micrococcal nuclease
MKRFILFLVLSCLSVKIDPAAISRVIDGDTVELYTIGVPNRERVRVLGINTPEKNQPLYREATEFTREWLAKAPTTLEASCSRDSFGRLLGTFYREDGAELGQELIGAGLAVPYRKK